VDRHRIVRLYSIDIRFVKNTQSPPLHFVCFSVTNQRRFLTAEVFPPCAARNCCPNSVCDHCGKVRIQQEKLRTSRPLIRYLPEVVPRTDNRAFTHRAELLQSNWQLLSPCCVEMDFAVAVARRTPGIQLCNRPVVELIRSILPLRDRLIPNR
jgi:hypothetical protein